MRFIFLKIVFSIFIVSFLFGESSFCFAKYTVGNAQQFLNDANKGAGVEQTDVYTLSGRIVKVGLTVVGLLFFILIFYSGYKWLVAHGNEEQITKAKGSLVSSMVGLMIVVGSYAATNFVVNRLIGGQTAGSPQSEKTADKVPTGPLGCCLDEVEASGGFWDWGSAHHWLSSITDEAICKEQGLTCGDNDQVCGSENWQFIKGVTSEDECWQIAQNKNTN